MTPWSLLPAKPAVWTPIALDVTDRKAAVARVHGHFGGLDVVVNNAGYGEFGMVEELSEAESREQIETNLFGALWVTQAALPFLRPQGSGHILQVSSIGEISAFPILRHLPRVEVGAGRSEPVARAGGFGIKVTSIGPGGYSTDWGGTSAKRATALPAYEKVRQRVANQPSLRGTLGDPVATRDAVLTLMDSDKPPLGGSSSVRRRCHRRLRVAARGLERLAAVVPRCARRPGLSAAVSRSPPRPASPGAVMAMTNRRSPEPTTTDARPPVTATLPDLFNRMLRQL